MIIKTNSYLETIEFGKKLGSLLKPGDVVLLSGDLGAGKTTLTKGIGQGMGVTRVINSPTFTICKEYKGNYKLYHLDLYRLETLGTDFDLEEYFNSDGVCVCEWAHNVEALLPSQYLEIDIFYETEEQRRFELNPVGTRYERIVGDLNVQFNN